MPFAEYWEDWRLDYTTIGAFGDFNFRTYHAPRAPVNRERYLYITQEYSRYTQNSWTVYDADATGPNELYLCVDNHIYNEDYCRYAPGSVPGSWGWKLIGDAVVCDGTPGTDCNYFDAGGWNAPIYFHWEYYHNDAESSGFVGMKLDTTEEYILIPGDIVFKQNVFATACYDDAPNGDCIDGPDYQILWYLCVQAPCDVMDNTGNGPAQADFSVRGVANGLANDDEFNDFYSFGAGALVGDANNDFEVVIYHRVPMRIEAPAALSASSVGFTEGDYATYDDVGNGITLVNGTEGYNLFRYIGAGIAALADNSGDVDPYCWWRVDTTGADDEYGCDLAGANNTEWIPVRGWARYSADGSLTTADCVTNDCFDFRLGDTYFIGDIVMYRGSTWQLTAFSQSDYNFNEMNATVLSWFAPNTFWQHPLMGWRPLYDSTITAATSQCNAITCVDV